MASRNTLKIAVTVAPAIPVPPRLYGGIERIVNMLVCELLCRGHEVTLFAHRQSEVPCKLEAYPMTRERSRADLLRNTWHVSSKILAANFDLVHSFGRLAYLLPILPLPIPKILTYQLPITERTVLWGERLARGTLFFTGCSRSLISRFTSRPNWTVIHNGVPTATYRFQPHVDPQAPLVFLGRLEAIKGPHIAIDVAHRTGRKLVIAGNVSEEPHHRNYFRKEIEPHLDGTSIQYIGPVTDSQKNDILGRSAALLMPVQWDEPFGIVMAEALACGTPVIGFNRGSVAEVVRHGKNGFVCESVADMIAATHRIHDIDRLQCRRSIEESFSDTVVVNEYEGLYRRVLEN